MRVSSKNHPKWLRPLVWTVVSSLCIPAESIAAACFEPAGGGKGGLAAEIDPKSAVCRAMSKELNARCTGPGSFREFRPTGQNAAIMRPAWEPIPLFSPTGEELPAAFDLLTALVRGRAIAASSRDHEQIAARDISEVLRGVRQARAGGERVTFEKVHLDFNGNGYAEEVFRLQWGNCEKPWHQAMALGPNAFGCPTPRLYLQRAIGLKGRMQEGAPPPLFDGGGVTGGITDIVLIGGAPHTIQISSSSGILVYRIRPFRNSNAEGAAVAQPIIPAAVCLFNFKPPEARR